MSQVSLSRIVSVAVQVSAAPPAAPSLSGIAAFGKSTTLKLSERVKRVTPDSYGGVFAANKPEYRAAAMAFKQRPQPDAVFLARRFFAAQAGVLAGAPVGDLSALQEITDGAFDITVDGTLIHVTGLDLHSAGTLAAVASAIQTKLAAGLAGTTCAVNTDGTGFDVTSPTTGTSSQVGYAAKVSEDDVATTLGLSSDAGALRTVGIAAETTITDTLNAARRYSGDWFGFVLCDDADLTDQTLAADWAEANMRPFYVATPSPSSYAAPTSGDTDIAGYAKRKGYAFTIPLYTTDDVNAAISMAARMATVDYLQPNSVISLWGKQLPGVAVEDRASDIIDGLEAKNCNVYANFGGFSMVSPGKTAGGRFVDEVLGVDCWLANQLRAELFAALVAMPQGIAQTDEDVYKLVLAAESALRKGVVNKLLAPGYWPTSADKVGEVKPGDFVKDGYYVVAQSVAAQSTADRAARLAPPMTAIAMGAGRVQAIRFNVIFNR